MILHFPIALSVLYLLYILLLQDKLSPPATAIQIGEWLLLLSAFTAAVTAIMGLFLSREEGYDAEAVMWHKWGGVAVSLLLLAWYSFRHRISATKAGTFIAAMISFAFIIFTGHQGAGITHGQNFLLAPLLPEKKQQQVLLEDAEVFKDMVRPILETKCMGCHNSKKAKGELVMETPELLLKGGKKGKLWDTTEADFGLLMKRIHLPLEAKKHMPPQGKPQLTEEEISILGQWIKSGADFKVKVLDLDPGSELRKLATNIFTTIETDVYDFVAADENKVKSLNNDYRVVSPLAKNSPALSAEFFSAAQFRPESLKDLLAIKGQLVSLNLAKMPVTDEDMKTIGQFTNLRRLNLSFTNITGGTLNELKGLKELKHLSLSGTKITAASLNGLSSLNQLTKLFIWNTGLKKEDVAFLKNKNLIIETGFRTDTMMLKLTPPILENTQQVLLQPQPLKLKHYINGVTIRYTLDGTSPDSIRSPVYANEVMIDGNAHLKAIAYKPGWYSSDTTTMDFYTTKYRPDSVIQLLPPDNYYKDERGKTLIDGVKGDVNLSGGKWIGFRNNSMEALMMFHQPSTMSTVTVSSLVDTASYVMPPLSLELWGGNDSAHLELLSRLTPVQPQKPAKPSKPGEASKRQPAYFKLYELRFKPTTVRFLKLIANPVIKLPPWHSGKGQKGWFFVDELIVN
ncbi:MAG TPA: FN3 associated domain-containing protein [Chitinophagaceae bacterium]|nr:FN3 associated domain-containing protein [Chitinophagaceae bacterium]